MFLLLDRYIFREWLKIFAMTVAALIGLLLAGRAFGEVPDFMKWKTSTAIVLEYFAIQTPVYFPLVLPVALLISVLYLLGFFQRNRELVAMRAAGMSIFRITRALWVAGAVLAALLFYLNGTVVPWATERSRFLLEKAENDFRATDAGIRETGSQAPAMYYANNADNRIWSVNHFTGYTGKGYGISIYQKDAGGKLRTAWIARAGTYLTDKKCWELEDGVEVQYDPATGEPVRRKLFSEMMPFTGKVVLPEIDEVPRTMLALTKKPKYLSINEIRNALDDAGGEDASARMAQFAVQYHYVLASPFCCLVVIGLAIPFSTSGGRVNPMVGVSKSAVLFALYYVATNLCSLLGSQQHLSPVVAAWLPNVLMFGIAVWFCRKVN